MCRPGAGAGCCIFLQCSRLLPILEQHPVPLEETAQTGECRPCMLLIDHHHDGDIMTDERVFLLAHISDLHFSAGTDRSNPNHAHSIVHLLDLQRCISELEGLDFLIASGDISNHGDRQSLITASGWLLHSIPIGAGEYTGLNLPPERVGVVPGNHDAWNASSGGTLLDRRQKSLENYNFAFPDHVIPQSGCYFRWIQKGDFGLYIAFVDSCFLGDTEEHTESPFGTLRFDQALAKGKLTVTQTEQLLEWHDRGSHGLLEIPGRAGSFISKEAFSCSLKILVMHHYLFEPPERKSDYFMRVHHRDVVFRNVALSDFDILLCGHKHVPSFDVHDYGTHFDRRAVSRYMLNYFRRLIGLESLPIQFVDDKGRRFSKALTQLVEVIGSWVKRFGRRGGAKATLDDGELAERVFDLLKGGLDSPDRLRQSVEKYLRDIGVSGASTLEPGELKRIQKRIATGISVQDRKSLRKVADQVSEISKKLKSRAFVQIMSGSSAKVPSSAGARRAFQTYSINRSGTSWIVKSQRYEWNGTKFLPNCEVRMHSFSPKV